MLEFGSEGHQYPIPLELAKDMYACFSHIPKGQQLTPEIEARVLHEANMHLTYLDLKHPGLNLREVQEVLFLTGIPVWISASDKHDYNPHEFEVRLNGRECSFHANLIYQPDPISAMSLVSGDISDLAVPPGLSLVEQANYILDINMDRLNHTGLVQPRFGTRNSFFKLTRLN